MIDFDKKYEYYVNLTETALSSYMNDAHYHARTLSEAEKYSLLDGGKRIRPVLCLAFGDMLKIQSSKILPFACAIEMIHTFSLIHDDLPCMDNDDFRRGKLTNHKVFGEAIAVLAGDALLNHAYRIMIQELIGTDIHGMIKAMDIICRATGEKGMIAGQVLDIEYEKQIIDFEDLKNLHSMKTGALIKAPIEVAAAIAGINSEDCSILEDYGNALGLAFQIKDDILDFTSDSKTLGKSAGKDAKSNKSTYVTLLGIEKSNFLLEVQYKKSISSLEILQKKGYETEFLYDITNMLLNRKK